MTDARFTTVFNDLAELLEVVDLDDVDDLETLMMAVLQRPLGVTEGWDEDSDADGLDVRIHGSEHTIGQVQPFPLSILELARSSAELAAEVGPYTAPGEAPIEGADLSLLTDDELVEALTSALGQVRIYNLFEDD